MNNNLCMEDSNPNPKKSNLGRDDAALITTLSNSIQALGRGFDVTSDIRLLYCNGTPGSSLVHLDEQNLVDLLVPDEKGVFIPNVSVDIECSQGTKITDATPVCNFHEEALIHFLTLARVWAPEQNNLQRKEPVCAALQFSLMGPKLYISPDQVTVGRKPVTGLRLSLEGSKLNRLSVNLQHLVSLPKILQPHWDAHMAIGAPKWKGPEEQDSRWFEPIKWKNFSHVSTAPIEHTETSIGDLSGVHIVTGAQLGVWDFGAKSVLHLKLLFSKVPGCTIRRSVWDHSPSNLSAVQRIDGSSTSLLNENKKGDSSSQMGKLAKIVDMTEMSKGPQDAPGHWLVTGAKLGVDKGKIVLRVKYSLLNY